MGFGAFGLGGCGCCTKCATLEECWSDDFSSYGPNVQELYDAGYNSGASMRVENERLLTRDTVFNFGFTGAVRAIAFDPTKHTSVSFSALLDLYTPFPVQGLSVFFFAFKVGLFLSLPRAYVNLNRDQTYSTGGYNLTPINHGLTLPGDRFGLEASTTSYDGTTIEMDCDFTRNDIAIRTETISLVEVDGGSNDPSFDFCLTQYGVLGTGYSDNWAFEIDNGCS